MLTKLKQNELKLLEQKRPFPFGVIRVPRGEIEVILPVVCEILWTPKMGERLMKARMHHCPIIDRRRWRHHPDGIGTKRWGRCNCLTQPELARQLSVSQATISKIENAKLKRAPIKVQDIYSVFGDAAIYILTGLDRQIYERFSPESKEKEPGEEVGED